tara:strand:+ start:503 stop:2134 length:1632 start_codon:yes stop_codon:yes gene_type:complete
MLDIQADALTDAREAAREAARIKGDDGDGDIPDAKVEEKKAGGFFSRMGKAIMNPVGAMGRGMKSMGKGIQGFLTGLANGLMAFANPLVLVGVSFLSISLPIFAAGLAAAFKVFDMIMGKGEAIKMVTAIIESFGRAIGSILKDILEGIGLMVQRMGPLITKFFDGLAVVIKALHPIIVDIFEVIKDIITDPVFNKTMMKVLDLMGIALEEISAIIQKTGDVIIAVMTNVDNILTSIFDGISKVIKTIGDAIIGIIDKIVEGVERLAELPAGNMLKVAGALGVLAVALVGFSAGAAIASGTMPSAEDLDKIANSVKKFADLEPGNLAAVGDGMEKVGLGLAIFGGGSKVAELLFPEKAGALDGVAEAVQKFGKIDATNFAMVGDGIGSLGVGLMKFGGGGFLSSLGEAFGKLIGSKDPVEKFKKFAEIGPELSQAGMGVTALANAFDAFDGDNLEKIGNSLDKFLGATDMAKLKAFSAATEGLVSGQMLAQLQVQTAEAARTGRPLIIQSSTNTNVNNNSSAVLAGSPISTEDNSNTSKMSGG